METTKRINIIKDFAKATFLVLIFASFWVYTSAFTHQHIYKGQVVTHSHPFAEDTPEQHNHSSFELLYIEAYSNLNQTELSISPLPTAVIQWLDNYCFSLPESSESIFSGKERSPRAPPVCAFSVA